MSRKRRVTTVEGDILPSADAEDSDANAGDDAPEATPEEIEVQDKVLDALAGLDGLDCAIVRIYRRGPGATKFSYCGKYTLDEFSADGIDPIIKRYGGGDYQAKFMDANNKYIKFVSFQADPRVKGDLDLAAGENANGANGRLIAELNHKDQSFAALMLQMMQMQQQQAQQSQAMMMEVMRKPSPSATGELAKIFTPLIPLAIEIIKNRSQDSTEKTITMLAKAKELFSDGGGDGGGTIVEKMLAQFAPLVAAKMAGDQAAASPAGAPTLAQPESALQTGAGQPQIEQGTFDPNNPEMVKSLVIRGIRDQYPKLLKAAQKGSDPQSYFDVLLDELEEQPAQVTAALLALLKQEDWVPVLFGVEQLPFAPWFEKFRQCFLDWEKEQAEPEPAAVNAAPVTEKKKKA